MLILSLLLSLTSFADSTLLNCNIGGGDTQEATVLKTSAGLVLKELDNHGHFHERDLSQSEWKSGKMKLYTHEEFNADAYLKKDGKDWFVEYKSDGVGYSGYADCRDL